MGEGNGGEVDREEVGAVGESGKIWGWKYYCFVPRALGSRCAGGSEDSMLASKNDEAQRRAELKERESLLLRVAE